MATTTVEITIPDGLGAGDEFSVEWGGTSYSIAVPDGCTGGQALNIELPSVEEATGAEEAPATTAVEIVVPDGLGAGDEFSVEWGGTNYSIAVPDGVVGGQALTIELPALPADGASAPAADAPAPSADAPAPESPTIKIQSATGEIMTDMDQAMERLEQTCSDKCDMTCLRCDGYKFKPGQRIEVYRTDGAMSPGHIVGKGWEGVFGPEYKVQLDDGLCKEAVPEEEISDEVCDVADLFDGL